MKLTKDFDGNWVATHGDEGVDEITIKIIPRKIVDAVVKVRKDEEQQDADESKFENGENDPYYWGQFAEVTMCRKGMRLATREAPSLEAAIKNLAFTLDNMVDDAYIQKSENGILCSQPGCKELASVVMRMRKRFSRHEGYEMQPKTVQLRAFCEIHKSRGQMKDDDHDDHYEMFGNLDTGSGGGNESGDSGLDAGVVL